MILDDLADFLAEETTMTVHQAVLLLTADDELPRFRMSKSGLSHHALFSAPAGRFLCDLYAPGNMAFFSEIAERTVEVGELVRLDPKEEIVVERNWPSGKVQINGRYYAVPRNFARPLAELVKAQRANWRGR
ncbi:MAG: hypothetical protein R8J94_19600 [Acidimicrobiia bacterium]|nr:hypothetical protein [Acidimicrobiia bacterium]